MPSKQVNRRQFVKKSVVNAVGAGAAAAGAGAIARTARGCPIRYDENGKIVDTWCPVGYDDSNPNWWTYTWENCRTGDVNHILGPPNEPLGNCLIQGPPCLGAGKYFDSFRSIDVDGETFLVSKAIENPRLNQLISNLQEHPQKD